MVMRLVTRTTQEARFYGPSLSGVNVVLRWTARLGFQALARSVDCIG
jgi:hypothetical protein